MAYRGVNHAQFMVAVGFVESRGFKVTRDNDAFDIDDRNTYEMVKVETYGPPVMLDHYMRTIDKRPPALRDHFTFGSAINFMHWARDLYRQTEMNHA